MSSVKNPKLALFIDELRSMEDLADFTGYLEDLKASLDLKNTNQRDFFMDVRNALSGGDIRQGRALVADWPQSLPVEPIDRYLKETEGFLRRLAEFLPASDQANVFYEGIESYLRSGNIARAVDSVGNETLKESGRWLFPGILMAAALIAGVFGINDMFKAWRSTDWDSTEGRVLSSRVNVWTTSGGSGRVGMPGQRTEGSRSSTTTTHYSAEVVYEYRVGEKTYTNDKVAVAYEGDEAEAQEIVERYPVDAKVTVYFDPEDPGRSLLETGARGSTAVGLWLAGAFLAAALFMLLLPRLRRRTLAQRLRAEGAKT